MHKSVPHTARAALARVIRSVPVCLWAVVLSLALGVPGAFGAEGGTHGGEANLKLPDLNSVSFFGGAVGGQTLLYSGFLISGLGLVFGLVIYGQLKNLPVHGSMREVSELIYETCKAYMVQQGKFLLILFAFIGAVVLVYFKYLIPTTDASGAAVYGFGWGRVALVIFFGLVGMGGSYAVAWFGIRVNTFANSRTAFASLRGKPYPCYAIPLKAGMSIGMMLISVELLIMLFILLVLPGSVAGACLIGFAIGESLGASALRIAGGIFTKIADIGSDLMKIVFRIKEDDARNPGVIADCVGDNAGDSVGPSADGFETYGVTGVALIVFVMLAITPRVFLPAGVAADAATPEQLAAAAGVASVVQVKFLVWLFVMRIVMVLASGASYLINEAYTKARYAGSDAMNFERPLTNLVFLTSGVSIALTFLVSLALIPDINGDGSLWWKLSAIISCGTAAGAIIPELVKIFTSTSSGHVREVVTSSREGGASLNILSGLVAGNFSAFWLGITIVGLMAVAFGISTLGFGAVMLAPAVFAFGLVAFGFLSMGPVTIAVDSYGPVTDNAQSVFELSTIEQMPEAAAQIRAEHGFEPSFDRAKHLLEENDGAGNTFKATAKPVLIGTAVVGATTLIFSIIVALTDGLTSGLENLSILHPPFLLGLITGGAVIYWFTGASTQAVTTGAYRAVEFIKGNIRLEGSSKASVEDSRRVVTICTEYAQKGMFNIFLGVFFATLAFAFVEPFFFIGYLVSIALFGLFQAIFMANAGGAWDNAKKVVEVELKAKGTDLHAATVVGDTVGDPFKDTSSVAMNPVIKFTTLFGLLAVELAVSLKDRAPSLPYALSVAFFLAALFFVWRSFYGMQIRATPGATAAQSPATAH